MAHISPVPPGQIPESCRVPDQDNIIQIHSVHPEIMKLHYDLYLELMHGKSAWTRIQRERVAVVVSGLNGCHY